MHVHPVERLLKLLTIPLYLVAINDPMYSKLGTHFGAYNYVLYMATAFV